MKNLLRIPCLLLAGIFFLSCSQEEKKLELKRTVISGVVHNASDKANVLVVNYCNPLSEERQFAQNLTESGGHFHTSHEYAFPQNLTIRFANKFINIFVFPGDSLFVSIDAEKIKNNFTDAVEFSGENAGLNKELFLWTTYSYSKLNPQFDENASPEVLIQSVRKDFGIVHDSIESYSQRTDMSDFVKQWAFTDHKFIAANYLMDYKNTDADKWDVFTDSVFDVFNENNFQTMYFQYHLSACVNAIIGGDTEIKRLFSEELYAPAIRLTVQKLSEKAPEGVVRDVMLFSFLRGVIKEMPALYDSVPEIRNTFSQELFDKLLTQQLALSVTDSEESLTLSETERQVDGVLYLEGDETRKLPEVKLLNYLSEKYKGKVLYIDVWATWCGPCIEGFKYTPNLHKYFKDKDVVFINLCLESKMDNWLSAIKRYNVSGENYFLGDNASKLFRADNNLSGFPSYLIINKDGKILNNAPRPVNLESVIQSIESYLK